jgi:hypothetical protein
VNFIPGNHDCDFRNTGDLRPRLLANIDGLIATLDNTGETTATLLQVQKNFFEFVTTLTGEDITTTGRLYRSRTLLLGGKKIELRLYNSAWLSQRHDEPGKLGFPAKTVDQASELTDSDLVVSLIHHPINWLNPSVYQSFRRAIQKTTDFLLTGHEHAMGGQVISPFEGSSLVHLESGPLQPTDSGDSEFCILHIDLDARVWRKEDFWWSNGGYGKLRDGSVQELSNKPDRYASPQLTHEIVSYLTDPGTGFLHPRQQNLKLSDIYIYPDLKTRTVSRKLRNSDDLPARIQSHELPEKLLNVKRVVIAGPSDSGKTALLKMLYLSASLKDGSVPLLLRGKYFPKDEPQRSLRKAIESAIDYQYGKEAHSHLQSLDINQRMLIVDDWEDIHFGKQGRRALISCTKELFGSIVIASDDAFLIDETAIRHEGTPLEGFEFVDIMEFGYRLRGDLARKWHTLGYPFIADEKVFEQHLKGSINAIDTILGRNLLPSYPVNILTLLQTYDAGSSSQSSDLGSYGQVYEALITARLVKVSIRSIDIGTKITFLSRFAWALFNQQAGTLPYKDWVALCDQYLADYGIRLEPSTLKEACIEANILTEDELGLRFPYAYGYCYFVAKYFQENLAYLEEGVPRSNLFARLKELSELVYNQNNANIVIFYVFLTKDRSIISHVIKNASKILATFEEFDFDSHVDFLNSQLEAIPLIELPASSYEKNQRDYNEKRDERGEQLEPNFDSKPIDIRYTDDLAFQYKFVIALRYLMLMGQILRNFPGSLKSDTKLELAFESYSLGLRILGAVFKLAGEESEIVARDIANVLRSKMAFSGSDSELLKKAEQIITDILRDVTFSLLKRISHAVGLKELELTYDEVAELRDHNLSNRMIRLSIELDHFDQFPKVEVESLAGDLRKNFFSFQTLRDLVMNHLYLFPREYSIQQWCGGVLNMKVNLPEIRGESLKIKG